MIKSNWYRPIQATPHIRRLRLFFFFLSFLSFSSNRKLLISQFPRLPRLPRCIYHIRISFVASLNQTNNKISVSLLLLLLCFSSYFLKGSYDASIAKPLSKTKTKNRRELQVPLAYCGRYFHFFFVSKRKNEKTNSLDFEKIMEKNKFHFGHDSTAPQNFNVIANTSNSSCDKIVGNRMESGTIHLRMLRPNGPKQTTKCCERIFSLFLSSSCHAFNAVTNNSIVCTILSHNGVQPIYCEPSFESKIEISWNFHRDRPKY